MARNSLLCADVPLRNYSLTHSLHRAITVCSIYLPPTAKYDNAVIDNFITQLPSPAQYYYWGTLMLIAISGAATKQPYVASNLKTFY